MLGNPFSNFRVLIVDDERMMHKLVRDILTQFGFQDITSATSGRKAIELASRQTYDFVITDWRMGDLDGIDLVRFLRQAPNSPGPRTPVIMLTGNSEAHYVLTALDAGVNGYLIKPFSVKQLVQRIRTVIEQPQPFVWAPTYCGPDRRHVNKAVPNKSERRKRKPRMLKTEYLDV